MNSSMIPYPNEQSDLHITLFSGICISVVLSGICMFAGQKYYEKRCPRCNKTIDKGDMLNHINNYHTRVSDDPINDTEIPIIRD